LLLVICFSAVLIAQTPDTATIRGQVLDTSGAAVSGASVTLANTQSGQERAAVSDQVGNFAFAGVAVGTHYELSASKAGFTTATAPALDPIAGVVAVVNLRLGVQGQMAQVNVTGTPGAVRTDSPQIGQYLDAGYAQEMPLSNRRITFLPLLNAANRPAINQGDIFMNQNLFTTNGAGRRQTWFESDGVNAVDLWGRQTIFTNFPVDSLTEMTVLTNSFSAEYGFGVGSVVNMVTESGTDKFHGSVLGLWRPEDASSRLSGFAPDKVASSGTQITSDRLVQGAVSLSGPIAERTYFAANAEYSWEDRASPVTAPVAPQSYLGKYRDALGILRLDHAFSNANNGFLKFVADAYRDTNPGGAVGGNTLPTVGRIFRRRTYSAEIGDTASLSANLLNDVRLQFQLASPITEFDPILPGTQFVVPIAGVGTFTTGTSQSALLLNHQFEVSDTVSYVHGRHTIKFGADVIRAHSGGNSKEFGGPLYLGQFTYNPCPLSQAECESAAYLDNLANVKSYTQSYGNGSYTVDDTLWSVFAQDDYRVSSRLTVNLGLRYERQTFTDSTLNFAPRVGFALDLFGDSKTVLHGGFGIYYSQVPDNAEANYALTGPTGVFNFTASAGQVGFPTSVSAVPIPAFPAGAQMPLRSLYIRPGDAAYYNQYFPVSTLLGYQNGLWSPYTEQWNFGLEREIAPKWVLSMDYVGSHTVKVNRPLDVDPPTSLTSSQPSRKAQAANCTRPYWMWWYTQQGTTCDPNHASNPQPPYALIQSDVNDGYANYNALDVNLRHQFGNRLNVLASYTWSHALDNVDPDIPGQNPNDPRQTGRAEYGNAIFDQRHRFVLSGVYSAPFKINFGGTTTLGSGLPYNIASGATLGGDNGAVTERPIINGVLLSRNAGQGRPIYDVSPFVERPFNLGGDRVRLTLRAESFNVLNHHNYVGYSAVYGTGSTPPQYPFGQPLSGITAQLPPRSFQFLAKVVF
jgi:hypothetical protein